MFEKITLRRNSTKGPPTAGHIAEALLYHQNVHLVLDPDSLRGLAEQLGPHELITLLERPEVNCTFTPQFFATITRTHGGMMSYQFGAMSIERDANQKKYQPIDHATRVFEKFSSGEADAKRLAKKFLNLSQVRTFDSNYYLQGGISAAARKEAEDRSFFSMALAAALAEELRQPELALRFHFNTYEVQGGYFISSNVDWNWVNQQRKRVSPGTEDYTTGHLAAAYLEAIADLYLAAHYGGEFVTSDASSRIARIRYSALLRRVGRDTEAISAFQDALLDNCSAVRECINSGDRTMKDFLKLLDHRDAKKFKDFLAGVNPDTDALKSYYEENSKQGWLQSLPTKSIRWLLATGAGVINPPVGAALSLGDLLLIDRLKTGWKPSHFIEGRLKPFLNY